MKDLKQKLRTNELTLGSWISLGHTAIAEIMAKTGFDWLTIDMEHSAIELHEAQQLIQVIELSGVVPLVRVGENSALLIKRVMDAGAHGVIVPMVNTKEDAVRAVESTKYPPVGKRGIGLARAQGYGFRFEEYKEWLDKKSIVVVQIEHIDAIKNLEDILSVKGVDGSIVGPYDLSGSLGKPGDFGNPEMQKALLRYETISKKMKKAMGFHVVQPDIKKAAALIKSGYTFLAVGLDTLYIGEKCMETLNGIKRNVRC